MGIGVVSSLISHFHDSQFDTHKHSGVIKKCLFSSAVVYEACKIIFKKIKPDKVVTFNSRFFATKPIIIASQDFKINVERHERGSNYKKY